LAQPQNPAGDLPPGTIDEEKAKGQASKFVSLRLFVGDDTSSRPENAVQV